MSLRAGLRLLLGEPIRDDGTGQVLLSTTSQTGERGLRARAETGPQAAGTTLCTRSGYRPKVAPVPLQPRQTVTHLSWQTKEKDIDSESHFEIKIFQPGLFRRQHLFQSVDLMCHLRYPSPLQPTNIHEVNELNLIKKSELRL